MGNRKVTDTHNERTTIGIPFSRAFFCGENEIHYFCDTSLRTHSRIFEVKLYFADRFKLSRFFCTVNNFLYLCSKQRKMAEFKDAFSAYKWLIEDCKNDGISQAEIARRSGFWAQQITDTLRNKKVKFESLAQAAESSGYEIKISLTKKEESNGLQSVESTSEAESG